MEYRREELTRLHSELVDILKVTVRVCDILKIPYFIIGGTAVGAFFHKGFVPWDDDLDLGMTRGDYQRFIKEAPSVLPKGYFLQCFDTEPNTPFYYVKIRKDNTQFIETPYRNLNIHHGIFIDIFPFDNVPDNPRIERIHRRIVQYCEGSFKRSLLIETLYERYAKFPSSLATLLSKIQFSLIRILPRKFYYWCLCKVQSVFNRKRHKFVSIVKMPLDQIATEDVLSPQIMEFEGVSVFAPAHIETYLRHHYPYLSPTPPEEYRITHAPEVLSFNQ